MTTSVDIRELIVDLQTHGLRKTLKSAVGRQGGAGPANGGAIDFGPVQALIATTGASTQTSPFSIEHTAEGDILMKNDSRLCPVRLVPVPHIYSMETAEGINYKKIAMLHGKDCLASTVLQTCFRWNTPEQCRFCGIGTTLVNNSTIAKKTPEQLAEVVEAAVRLDGVTHMTLTSGSRKNTETGIRYYAECARAIKKMVPGFPLHVQFEPYEGLTKEILLYLKESGVDTVGIHVESFDQAVREKNTPGKARISLDQYFAAFKLAVEVFGYGQVSTFVIIGLGETREATIAGCRHAIEIGVYPFLVPFTPVAGSPMKNNRLPDKQELMEIYIEVAGLLRQAGIRSENFKAGCVRCGACSALPAFERC